VAHVSFIAAGVACLPVLGVAVSDTWLGPVLSAVVGVNLDGYLGSGTKMRGPVGWGGDLGFARSRAFGSGSLYLGLVVGSDTGGFGAVSSVSGFSAMAFAPSESSVGTLNVFGPEGGLLGSGFWDIFGRIEGVGPFGRSKRSRKGGVGRGDGLTSSFFCEADSSGRARTGTLKRGPPVVGFGGSDVEADFEELAAFPPGGRASRPKSRSGGDGLLPLWRLDFRLGEVSPLTKRLYGGDGLLPRPLLVPGGD
jgi:hypothetical protein